MTEDAIERCDTFNAKGYPYELLFGSFHDKPIPPGYYDFFNDNGDDDNNNPGTPVENLFLDKEGVDTQSFQTHPTWMITMKTMTMIQKMMMLIVKPWPFNPPKTKF